MLRSIRRYLLVHLALGVQFATLLAVTCHLYLGYASVRPHLDAQMAVTAHAIKAFFIEEHPDNPSLATLQQRAKAYLDGVEHVDYDDQQHIRELHSSLDTIHFRVFSKM